LEAIKQEQSRLETFKGEENEQTTD